MFRVLTFLLDEEELLSGRHLTDLHITAYLLNPQLQLPERRPFENKVLVTCPYLLVQDTQKSSV